MLLSARLDGVIEVTGEQTSFSGSPYWEASLVSDDAQTLHVHEGHLKETALERLEVGGRYRVTFRPFVNNRWLELKVCVLAPEDAPASGG